MYITIEGIDTAGKSTQINALTLNYPNAIITKEPGATGIGKEIREMVLSARAQSKKAEFLLFLADRAEHVKEIIEPNIDTKMIISDRSIVSGVAYALIQGEISETEILYLNRFATNGIYPQKVFLLKLTKKELEYRLSQKKLDGIELRGSEYLLKIQDALIEASKLLKIELVEIDATLNRDEITQGILNNINSGLLIST
jgi:dTMP kinase